MWRERLWHTRYGQRICYIITNFNHVFSGWNDPRHAANADGSLNLAYCDRCGAEF